VFEVSVSLVALRVPAIFEFHFLGIV
jgi:hypothetical protein